MPSADEDWLPVAKLLRPQGRRGELLAEPHADPSLFKPGMHLWLVAKETETPQPTAGRELDAAWQPTGRNAGRIVLKLRGSDSISDAEALIGKFLLLRASEFPALEEDTFRVRDLVGCSLFDGDQFMGTISDIQFPVASDGRTRLTDAPDLLAVTPVSDSSDAVGEDAVLIPFVRAWLEAVDLPAKRITMHLPPGLFDQLSDTLE